MLDSLWGVEREDVKGVMQEAGGPWRITRETEAACDAGHNSRDEVVQVAEGGHRELEGAKANVIERLVVQDHTLVCVFHQLVHREGCIVGLHHGIRYL